MKKSTKVSSVLLAIALAGGTFSIADASTAKHSVKVAATSSTTTPSITGSPADGLKTILDGLVTKNTITAAQETAILDAIKAALPAGGPGRRGHMGPMGGFAADRAARDAVITSTLGITQAALDANEQAGKSLASLAGSKTADLITALVAFETKQIDAAVTAGTLTSAQAATLKSNLTAHITAEVNATPGVGGPGAGGPGFRGHGPDGDGDFGGNGAAGSSALTPSTGAPSING